MFVVLRHFSNRAEAEIVRGLLEANQIFCKIKSNDVAGLRPEMNMLWPVEVLVDEADLLRAKKLLAVTTGHL